MGLHAKASSVACELMLKIYVSAEAYEAITKSLPRGRKAYPSQQDERRPPLVRPRYARAASGRPSPARKLQPNDLAACQGRGRSRRQPFVGGRSSPRPISAPRPIAGSIIATKPADYDGGAMNGKGEGFV